MNVYRYEVTVRRAQEQDVGGRPMSEPTPSRSVPAPTGTDPMPAGGSAPAAGSSGGGCDHSLGRTSVGALIEAGALVSVVVFG